MAFGFDPDDQGAEYLELADGSTAHLFEAYAMANLLLCSALEPGTVESRSTGIMRGSCSRHMRATVGILQPSLVISQGAVLDETLRASLGVTRPVNAHLAHCELDGNKFVWVSLKHPTRLWRWMTDDYLWEVVEPSIRKARALALRLP